MEFLLIAGIATVAITYFTGRSVATPYTPENKQQVAGTQRKLCISYTIGFGIIAYSAFISLTAEWWGWVIVVLSGLMAFGALLEAKKEMPNSKE